MSDCLHSILPTGSPAGSRPGSASKERPPSAAAAGSKPPSRPASATKPASRPASAAGSKAGSPKPASPAGSKTAGSPKPGSRPGSATKGSRPGSAAKGSRPASQAGQGEDSHWPYGWCNQYMSDVEWLILNGNYEKHQSHLPEWLNYMSESSANSLANTVRSDGWMVLDSNMIQACYSKLIQN